MDMQTCNYMRNFICVFFCTSCAIECTDNNGEKILKYWKSQFRLRVAIYNTFAQNKLITSPKINSLYILNATSTLSLGFAKTRLGRAFSHFKCLRGQEKPAFWVRMLSSRLRVEQRD